MDTSDYETNVFLINGISSVSFQLYEPSPDQSQPFASIAPDLESTLQDEGRILHYDTSRRALWHFYIPGSTGAVPGQDGGHGGRSLGETLEFGGLRIGLTEEGSFEPVHLFKGRHFGPRTAHTPTSSSPAASTLDASLRLATSAATPTSTGPNSSVHQDTKKAPMATAAVDGKTTSVTVKDAYEHFITALLSTISASFCRRSGAIPLSHRNVLLGSKVAGPVDRADGMFRQEMAVIGTFRVYLTTTGSLLVSLSLSLSDGLVSMNEIPSTGQAALASQVLVGPFGILGNYQGLASALPYADAAGQTPDTRLWRVRPDHDPTPSQWREVCTRILRGRGLPLEALQGCTWIALQLFRRRHGDQKPDGKATPLPNASSLISWPSMLCFRKKSISLAISANDNGLGSLSGGELRDSLLEAKAWFDSDQEREEAQAHRRKAREMAASRELQSAQLVSQQPNSHSPMDPRRPANATAVTTMYPTPPDGVHHPLGITPAAAVEGNPSSPRAPSLTVAPVDADMDVGNTSTHAVPDSGQDSWDDHEARRERGESFLEEDPVFEDVGGDMFGDADVTDADFSFFDDQPGEGSLAVAGISDAAMPDVPTLRSESSQQEPAQPAPPTRVEPPDDRKNPDQGSPTFTKPELRHARSVLNNENPKLQTKNDDDQNSVRLGGTRKRELSPFDPDTVFKKVRASLIRPTSSRDSNNIPSRKGSVFDGVAFDPELPLTNKKYEAGGRFDCRRTLSQQKFANPSGDPPTTDYLRRHGNIQIRRPKSDRINALLQAVTGHLENSTLQANAEDTDEVTSDADDASVESVRMDSSESSDEPASPFKSTKRLNPDDDMASYATSVLDVESVVDESDPSLALDLPRIAKTEAREIAVTKYFEDPEPLSTSLSLSDESIMVVAQILTEQVISGTLHLRGPQHISFNRAYPLGARRQLASLGRSSSQALQDTLSSLLIGNATRSRLRSIMEVADIPLLGPPNRFQPRPVPSRDPNAEPPKPSNFYQIPPPHIEVKRLDATLSILPSAVAFWDTMGFSPSQGAKNISAACVFPNARGMSDNAATFLERIRHTYEFLKLGTFEVLPGHDETTVDGLVPWEIVPTLVSPTIPATVDGSTLTESMATLNRRLVASDATNKNFVIFVLYLPSRPETVLEACAAFRQLFEMYKRSLAEKRQAPLNELVLQLVAVDYLTSISGMPRSVPDDLTGLAMEVYDRCTVFGGPMPAPAIVLDQSIPRAIDFRLSQTSSSSLMNENTCMHIAYAQSIDERWITAAWTDNRGSQQMTASYCLGRKGRPLSGQFTEVANEIWETTHDLISRWKVHWRVIISKCGHMEQSEVDFWVALAQTESQASISLTLLSVDTDPSLQLIPPAVKAPVTAATSFYTTPVSTPQPSSLSPDQSGGGPATPMKDSSQGAATPGGTPGGNIDGGGTSSEPAEGDAILVDVTDQTWGVVLSHRLAASSAVGCLDSALVSGYLIKRGGTNVEEPPVAMEVNIIHSDGHPRAHEALLREMLHKFRGLGTLARARGMVDRETDVRPWHIAAAEKGVRALYLLL